MLEIYHHATGIQHFSRPPEKSPTITPTMSHTHEKTIADQHLERVGTTRSIHSGTDSAIAKDNTTTEILAAQDEATRWVNGTPEEKKLVSKLDWRILPCTWTLYLLGFLDRANIGSVTQLTISPLLLTLRQQCQNRRLGTRFRPDLEPVFHNRAGLLPVLPGFRGSSEHDPHTRPAQCVSPRLGSRLGDVRCANGSYEQLAATCGHEVSPWVCRGIGVGERTLWG